MRFTFRALRTVADQMRKTDIPPQHAETIRFDVAGPRDQELPVELKLREAASGRRVIELRAVEGTLRLEADSANVVRVYVRDFADGGD